MRQVKRLSDFSDVKVNDLVLYSMRDARHTANQHLIMGVVKDIVRARGAFHLSIEDIEIIYVTYFVQLEPNSVINHIEDKLVAVFENWTEDEVTDFKYSHAEYYI